MYDNANPELVPTNSTKVCGNEYTDFIQSKHYFSNKVSCTTCHNPHGLNSNGLQLNTDGLSICATCHDVLGSDNTYWRSYIDQHMPLTVENAFKFDMRNHMFR